MYLSNTICVDFPKSRVYFLLVNRNKIELFVLSGIESILLFVWNSKVLSLNDLNLKLIKANNYGNASAIINYIKTTKFTFLSIGV